MSGSQVAILLVAALLVLTGGTAQAQVVVPSQGQSFDRNGLRDTGGGSSFVTPRVRPPEVKIVYRTFLTEMRQWTAADGRTMIGRLLAFSAPKPGEVGPLVAIKDGKVRFLRSGSQKPVDFPLEKLGKEDQEFIRRTAEAARKAALKPPLPAAKEKSTVPASP